MLNENIKLGKAKTFRELYGVYKITNLKTGDFYIGSGKLQQRYSTHRCTFNKKNIPEKSWLWENNNKLEDFEFEVIELLPSIKEKLWEREQHWVDNLKPNLNKYVENVRGCKRKPILQFDLKGNLIKEWEYIRQANKYGFQHQHIINCCKNKPKNKTHKGYIWKYK